MWGLQKCSPLFWCTELSGKIAGRAERQPTRGCHEELVSDKSGMYYRLWNAQAQYYAAEDRQEIEPTMYC